ncbi:FAD-dependent thymidylate synthase [Candidatus Dependentiae bacterium]|nr:FAD-dependent thymidylate synthase [Candidatus Dependentiae bacterium]
MFKQERIRMNKKIFIEDEIGFIELLDVFGSDLTIVNAARVSFNKESSFEVAEANSGSQPRYELSERDKKLIYFLAQYNHNTPFFHPILRFRIKMPIFVAREWWRSTIGFARNEVSRRYVTYEPECFIPNVFRKRDKNLKQGSKDEAVDNNDMVQAQVKEFCQQAIDLYNRLMTTEGVCPEQARMILPQSMYTEFIETASLAGYSRLVQLRTAAEAQREIQQYARVLSELVEPCFPVSWDALKQAGMIPVAEEQPIVAQGAVRAV